jgi:hypothetical protein
MIVLHCISTVRVLERRNSNRTISRRNTPGKKEINNNKTNTRLALIANEPPRPKYNPPDFDRAISLSLLSSLSPSLYTRTAHQSHGQHSGEKNKTTNIRFGYDADGLVRGRTSTKLSAMLLIGRARDGDGGTNDGPCHGKQTRSDTQRETERTERHIP